MRRKRQPEIGADAASLQPPERNGEPALADSTPLIVGIGASAGGLEAFTSFFHCMPVDAGIAFVLVQHLAPDRDSALAELLARVTAMPVREAVDGQAVEGGNVYVIPPDATLTILKGKLRLTRPAPPRPHRWPIDMFFASLAQDRGDRAACIVLAGTGGDGTRGLQLIKQHGGLTLVQSDKGHVALAGMPESAATTGLVDHILPVAQMPQKLLAYRRENSESAGVDAPDAAGGMWTDSLKTICALLRSKVGHDFSQYKQNTLVRRVQRRMHITGIDSVDAYLARLKLDTDEPQNLFRELLIGVTEFFRDPDAFRTLYDEAILPLIESKGASDSLRVWVPGCATGEEAYAIAILLKEATAQATGIPKLQIFATDINENALAIARAGRFQGAPAGVSAQRLALWFNKDGDGYAVKKEIREICIFSSHSVFRDPPLSRMDLISCRNLLIYLSTELQDRLARVFHYALMPVGFLFLGSSESMSRHADLFLTKSKKARLYQARASARGGQRLPSPAPGISAPARAPVVESPLYSASSEPALDQRVQRVMEKYSPAYIVINANHDIVRFSGSTSGFIDPSAGTASLNLFRILQRGLRASARIALREADTRGHAVVREGLSVPVDGRRRELRLIVEPLPGTADTAAHYVLAFVLDEAADAQTSAQPETAGHESDYTYALELEADAMRLQLRSAVSQLENAQQEMRSSAEEYQSVNEELQSSNEELETSKEEMQSINEELQTVNAELVVTNETLARLNNDLQNLLESTQIATLFLDTQLRVTGFTPTLTELFHLRDGDRGRPITEIAARIHYPELGRDVTQVLRTLAVVERVVSSTQEGPTFLLRMRPYRTTDNRIDGVVLTFVDITDRERASEQARLAAIVESSKDVIIGLGFDLAIVSWNASARRLLGYANEEILGKPLAILYAGESEKLIHAMAAAAAQDQQSQEFEMTWRSKGGENIAVAVRYSPVKSDTQPAIAGSVIVRDISERMRAARRMSLMHDELNHRVKNTLSIVQAIALQTLGGSASMQDFEDSFMPRLGMLSNTHSLLASVAWGDIDLHAVFESEFAPYQRNGQARIEAAGEPVQVSPEIALALSMAVHELLTNASKYGALSAANGRVRFTWRVTPHAQGRRLKLEWAEHGGPPVMPPARQGFGSRLITEGLPLELDAEVELDYAPAGLVCTIAFALPATKGSE